MHLLVPWLLEIFEELHTPHPKPNRDRSKFEDAQPEDRLVQEVRSIKK